MKVKRSVILDAPIDRVWATVRRFDDVVNWNPGVIALDIADGSRFRETLLAHSDIEHFYTYDIIESPLACSNYISTHRFIEITDGDKTLGIWQGEFDCDPADAAELEAIVGDMIYRDAQRGLNRYLQEQLS
jgi:ligand-binding SRPBCC domain-containing protein